MPFRYAQFCPLARAAEILGERWTLLVVRELLLGPKRFSDLQRPLHGVSPSVLADRLAKLESRGVIRRRTLPPPAPATLYELDDSGRALLPALIEIARWGVRFLDAPEPGDHLEPAWARLALIVFARRTRAPDRSFAIRLADGDAEIAFGVAGGPDGTQVLDAPADADVTIRSESPLAIVSLASGALDPRRALRAGTIRAEGDLEALADFPALFELDTASPGPEARSSGPHNQKGT